MEERLSLRKRIAEAVERHLGEIVDATMAAYVRSIPSVATADAAGLKMIRTSTTRATQAFLAMYADPNSPARQYVHQARAATLDRAGEAFGREDIVEMIAIGRQVIYQMARKVVEEELELSDQERREIRAALDGFLSELEMADEPIVEMTPDIVVHFLSQAETEEPDIR